MIKNPILSSRSLLSKRSMSLQKAMRSLLLRSDRTRCGHASFLNTISLAHSLPPAVLALWGMVFPAAIGAQLAFPNKLVIDIAGDGSIQMNIQELATAVINKLPVKVAILNNGFLGMVRQWQELFFQERYSHTRLDASVDFVKIAEAYGAVGLRATKPSEVEPVLKEAFKIKRPVFMDFAIDWQEKVYPMVPAGAAIDEMLFLEEKKKTEKKLKAVK